MDEKDPHELRYAAAIPPCAGIISAAAADKTLVKLDLADGFSPPARAKRNHSGASAAHPAKYLPNINPSYSPQAAPPRDQAD